MMPEVIHGFDVRVWLPYHRGYAINGTNVLAAREKRETLAKAMTTLVEQHVAALPTLGLKKERALKAYYQYLKREELGTAARKAARIGVDIEELQAIAILLGK